MSLSWKELVCHGLLANVGDPSLVKELLKIVMKGRWLFLEEEAREFHTSNVDYEDILLQYRLQDNMDFRVSSELPLSTWPKDKRMIVVLHDEVTYELKSSWKKIVKERYRKKRAALNFKKT